MTSLFLKLTQTNFRDVTYVSSVPFKNYPSLTNSTVKFFYLKFYKFIFILSDSTMRSHLTDRCSLPLFYSLSPYTKSALWHPGRQPCTRCLRTRRFKSPSFQPFFPFLFRRTTFCARLPKNPTLSRFGGTLPSLFGVFWSCAPWFRCTLRRFSWVFMCWACFWKASWPRIRPGFLTMLVIFVYARVSWWFCFYRLWMTRLCG